MFGAIKTVVSGSCANYWNRQYQQPPEPINEGFVVVENVELIRSLDVITHFVKNVTDLTEVNIREVEQACEVAERALKIFEGCYAADQEKLLGVYQALSEHSKDHVFSGDKRQVYIKVQRVFLQTSLVEKVVNELGNVVTQPKKCRTAIARTIDVARFAIHNHGLLKLEEQRHLLRVYQSLNSQNLENYTSQEEKDALISAKELFKKYSEEKAKKEIGKQTAPPAMESSMLFTITPMKPVPKNNGLAGLFNRDSPPEKLTEFAELDPITSPEEKDAIKNQANRAPEAEIKQKAKILEVLKNIAIYYLPQWLGESNSIMFSMHQAFISQFDQLVPPFIEAHFFNEPSKISGLDKNLINAVLEQVLSYVDYIERNPKMDIEALKQFREAREQQIKTELNKVFDLALKIDSKKVSPLVEFFRPYASHILLQMIKQSLTPYNVALILERFLDDKFVIDDLDPGSPPLSVFRADDEQFGTKVGNAIQKICKRLLLIGDPGGMMKVISYGLRLIIDLVKGKIGIAIQQAINKLKSSRCTLTPFLVVEHLLFHMEEGVVQPVMLSKQRKRSVGEQSDQKKSSETEINDQKQFEFEMNALKERVGKKLASSMFPFIKNTIQKEAQGLNILARKPLELLLEKADSIEMFVNTLVNRVWSVCQSEDMLQLLFLHILVGVKNGLSAPRAVESQLTSV
jgi:hypothetical protein